MDPSPKERKHFDWTSLAPLGLPPGGGLGKQEQGPPSPVQPKASSGRPGAGLGLFPTSVPGANGGQAQRRKKRKCPTDGRKGSGYSSEEKLSHALAQWPEELVAAVAQELLGHGLVTNRSGVRSNNWQQCVPPSSAAIYHWGGILNAAVPSGDQVSTESTSAHRLTAQQSAVYSCIPPPTSKNGKSLKVIAKKVRKCFPNGVKE